MKKLINLKKVSAFVMATTIALSVASCGGSNGEPTSSETATTAPSESAAPVAEIAKPDKIKVCIDTVFSSQMDPKSWQPFVDKYKEVTGIELEFLKPDHNEYYKQVSLAFTTGDIPDALEIGSVYYPTYANNGALWDMTAAWENSELKASGVVDEMYVDQLKINDVLYGFPMWRGNGTVTYVRQDWLDKLGMKAPTNYEEFTAMLDAFTNNDPDGNGKKDTYGITFPGIVQANTAYDLYRREYMQDAMPGIYQKEDGTWVDGMLEPEMKEALVRMKADFEKGYIDQEVVTNKTSTCRDKFYAGQVGVFNYWAGTWNQTLQNDLAAQTPGGVVQAIPAIEETYYNERPATAFAITSAAENPEGIFKYLIEYSHDGGEGQMLFTRGVEGVNYKVENGTYTVLPDPENPSKLYEKSWYPPELSISKFDDPIKLEDNVIESLEIFTNDRVFYPVPTVNDVVSQNQADVYALRDLCVSNAVTTNVSVDEALAQYEKDSKALVEQMLVSLNK